MEKQATNVWKRDLALGICRSCLPAKYKTKGVLGTKSSTFDSAKGIPALLLC